MKMPYKNLQWLWGADWKFITRLTWSASRGLPSDSEQLSRVTEFSVHFFFLHTLLSTIAFWPRCALKTIYSLWSRNVPEIFSLPPTYDIDVEMFGGKWPLKWHFAKKDPEVMHESCLIPPSLYFHVPSVIWKFQSDMQEIRTKGFHPPWHIFPFTLGFNRSFVSVGSNLHSFEVEESTMLLDDIRDPYSFYIGKNMTLMKLPLIHQVIN